MEGFYMHLVFYWFFSAVKMMMCLVKLMITTFRGNFISELEPDLFQERRTGRELPPSFLCCSWQLCLIIRWINCSGCILNFSNFFDHNLSIAYLFMVRKKSFPDFQQNLSFGPWSNNSSCIYIEKSHSFSALISLARYSKLFQSPPTTAFS